MDTQNYLGAPPNSERLALPACPRQLRLSNWQQLLENNTHLDEPDKLEAVNRLINRSVAYVSDQQAWGQDDYWATPEETLRLGQGDCEDFAIAKYFALLKLGVAVERLRLTYVKALGRNSAHMVLAYYPSPNAQPLILDNLNSQILPAAARRDLLPVYAFNGQGIYLAKAPTQKLRHPTTLLARWDELSARLQDSNLQPLL
ncbi:MAG: hypothetical protein CFE49_11245 [Pseudomonas sp. PGPPP3]|nr:MAG: hypothetical protein CFE49_11245 [Pseudomonas sp. PGPPP3]